MEMMAYIRHENHLTHWRSREERVVWLDISNCGLRPDSLSRYLEDSRQAGKLVAEFFMIAIGVDSDTYRCLRDVGVPTTLVETTRNKLGKIRSITLWKRNRRKPKLGPRFCFVDFIRCSREELTAALGQGAECGEVSLAVEDRQN